jgi:hypothetical protein
VKLALVEENGVWISSGSQRHEGEERGGDRGEGSGIARVC